MNKTNPSSNHAIQAAPANVGRASVRHQRSEWSYLPATDVYEVAEGYVIECDAPGLRADGIALTFDAGVLHLHGEVPDRYSEDAVFLRQEYGVGDVDREIPLGRLAEFVDGERASAEYARGVLTIRLPKIELAKPRRIDVKVKTA